MLYPVYNFLKIKISQKISIYLNLFEFQEMKPYINYLFHNYHHLIEYKILIVIIILIGLSYLSVYFENLLVILILYIIK